MAARVNFIAFAIPFFVLLFVLEFYLAGKNRSRYFNLQNVIANISIGITERLIDVFASGCLYFMFDWLQKHYGLLHIKPNAFTWLGLFLCTDFIWYRYHRLAHERNLLCTVHVVHHQSEDFNFTVSARITIFQAIVRAGFWAVLPIVGFPAPMIAVMLLLHGLYPFFTHTRIVGKLGWLEYILVTPSHHRVHHACNPQYLDKNYGDVLIIWDKLFGTFALEVEEPIYGLTKPLKSYSFLWQHFHFWVELWLAVKAMPTLKAKLRLLFGGPDLIDPEIRHRAEEVCHIGQDGNKTELNNHLNTYVNWQVGILLVVVFLFMLFNSWFNFQFCFCFTALSVLTLINCGAIMEQRKWIFNIELTRLFTVFAMLLPYLYPYRLLLIFTVFIIGLILLFYKTVQTRYLKVVYATTTSR